jgi:O-antigen/teichoic acid export membrane protein
VAVLAAVGLVPVVAYNRAFVRVWGFRYGGDAVTILAAVNALLLAEQSLWAWCFSATGKVRELVAPAVAAAALNLAASVVLTYRVGLAGPLIGSTVGFVAVGLWVLPLKLRRVFGTPTGALAWAAGKPCVLAAAAALLLREWVRRHPPAGWAGLLTGMSLSGLVMLALSAALLLTAEERALWRQRVRTLVPGGRPR